MTIEEAKGILAQQTQDLALMNRKVINSRDDIGEYEWKVQKKQKARDGLQEKLSKALKIMETTIKSNTEKDPKIEQDYHQYREAIEMCKRIHGIESITYVTYSHAQITFAKPYDAILDIHINLLKNVISNASVTGTRVKINDVLLVAKQMNSSNGIRMLIVQTMTRLKKESGRSLY